MLGAHVWGRTKRKLLPIYQIAGLDPELIQESRENLISHFQSKGYFDAAVQSEVQPAPDGQTILFRIIKGGEGTRSKRLGSLETRASQTTNCRGN